MIFKSSWKELRMKSLRVLAFCTAAALLGAATIPAQEKPKAAEEPKIIMPMRVQVVISEYEGEKKISSLPYTLVLNAGQGPQTQLRMGIRVPILVQGKEGQQLQYMDVGTDIDCSAQPLEEGRFKVFLFVRRSSVYSSGPDKKPVDWAPGGEALAAQPIIRQFSGKFEALILRDAQTIQSTMSTDPVSGRVLKVDVTLNVVK